MEHHDDRSVFVIAYVFVAFSGFLMGILAGIFFGWILWG